MERPMRIFLPLLLLCSLAHAAVCPTGQAKDGPTLVRIEQEWLSASARHDTAALECILADDFEEADSNGALIERSTMLSSPANPSDSHFELADLHAHVYGDVAYVRGKGVFNDHGVRKEKTRFTDIFVYRDGRWQCVAGHESRFPDARQPATDN